MTNFHKTLDASHVQVLTKSCAVIFCTGIGFSNNPPLPCNFVAWTLPGTMTGTYHTSSELRIVNTVCVLRPQLKNNVNIISAIEGTWSSVYFRNFRWNNETVLHFR